MHHVGNLFGDDSEQLNVNRDWLNSKKPFIGKQQKKITTTPQSNSGFEHFNTKKNEPLQKFSFKESLQDPKKRRVIVYVIQTAFAVLVFIIVVLILVGINPPLTQKKNANGWASGTQSGLWVPLIGFISAALMFSICEFVRYYKF